jgi:Na+/melibiose symporter-like transporter
VLLLFSVIIFVWLIIDVRKTAKAISNKKKKGKQTEHKFTFKSISDNRSVFFMPGVFLITAVGSVVVATALPYFDSLRLFFTVFVSFTLVFFSLLSEAVSRIENSEGKLKNLLSNKYLRIAVPVLICLITAFDFGKEYRIYHRDYVVYTNVVHSIEVKIAAGEKNIVIHKNSEIRPFLYPEGRLRNFIFYWSITGAESNPNTMENKWYAYCLGAETFSGGE